MYYKVIAYDRYERVRYPLTVIETIPEYNRVYQELCQKNLHIVTYTYYPNGHISRSERFIAENNNNNNNDLPDFNSPEAFFCEPD